MARLFVKSWFGVFFGDLGGFDLENKKWAGPTSWTSPISICYPHHTSMISIFTG
jgi:hypothetical protein